MLRSGSPTTRRVRILKTDPGQAEGALEQMEKLTEEGAPHLPDDTLRRHGGQ